MQTDISWLGCGLTFTRKTRSSEASLEDQTYADPDSLPLAPEMRIVGFDVPG